jgi:molecular chaperone GrpE
MPSSPVSEGNEQAVEDQPTGEGERDLAAELSEMEDRYKRALADLDNYRKRSARETERRIEDAREAQLREWLEVVDSLERALFMEPDNPIVQGLRAVLGQMETVLARQGVTRIDAAGEAFDPVRHEAVGVSPADRAPPGTVTDVTRSGFERNGHVLRPAEVVVSRSTPENE